MKIALFTPLDLSKTLGASKNRLEFAEALESLGCQTELFGRSELGVKSTYKEKLFWIYKEALQEFLKKNAAHFDVVLYEADSLPFARASFFKSTLFVARPALVYSHFLLTNIPSPPRSPVRQLMSKMKRRLSGVKSVSMEEKVQCQYLTCINSDLIQVQNAWDADALRAQGIRHIPIAIVPNGLTDYNLAKLLDIQRPANTTGKRLVFIGTFDYRKGCLDIVELFNRLSNRFSDLKLKLIGAAGMFQSEASVLAMFPSPLRPHVEVILRYDPSELSSHLQQATLGIFPSYVESFGFGCLEMMASGIPVVAYDSPGPGSFVPSHLLAERGNLESFTDLVAHCLHDQTWRVALGKECRNIAMSYTWKRSAAVALDNYSEELRKMRGEESLH